MKAVLDVCDQTPFAVALSSQRAAQRFLSHSAVLHPNDWKPMCTC